MADDWDAFEEVSTDDALKSLTSSGVEVTSGFRTPEDVERLKRQGYTPASHGGHLNGDGVDLVPGKSGMSLAQLADLARQRFGPKAQVEIHNGSHVDVKVPGWGNAPDVYRSDPWDAFKVEKPAEKKAVEKPAPDLPAIMHPSGTPHDGDTFTLNTGDRGRLYGVDAFELNQTGKSPSGETIPLGHEARDAFAEFATVDATAHPVGDSTYGRPVVTLENGGDAAEALTREGYALAEPEYLKADPARMAKYMEAERLARLNLLGAHGNTYQKPSDFRHGAPVATTAIFADDPTPEGLRPEIADGYLAIWDDMKSKPEDLLAYAKANGFSISEADTRAAYERRNKVGHATNEISYEAAPRPLIDPGDGKFGTTARGFGDPFNALDELGGVVDTIGGTGGRENVFNSDRRFGDILWNNIDQNRAIIDHDEETHPYYRLGGQLASAAALPGVGAETLAGRVGITAAEGGLQGFMGGEGGFTERLPDAAVGAAVGAAGGAVLHGVIEAAPTVINPGRKLLGREEAAVADEAPDAVRYAAMDDMPGEVIERAPDRIDVTGRPAVAPGTPEQRAVAAAADPAAMEATDSSRAANINLDKLYSATVQPGEIRAAMKFTADTFGDFMPARRGVQTWEKTDELAGKLGMTVDDLLSRRPGEAWNAEMIEGSNRLLDASSAKLIKLKDAALGGGEAEKAQFVKGLLLHAAITEEAAGMRAEAGRALGILRKASKAGVNDAQAIEDVLARLDKGTTVEQVAEMVGQLADDPSALNRFARDAIKPRFKDKLMFAWVMARLSSPATHIVNTVSNTLVALAEGPTYALAAGLGGARRAITGSTDRVYASELGPRFYGMLRGAREGLANAKEAFSIIDGTGKVRAEHGSIPFRNDKGDITTVGKIASLPGRALSAEDQIFKAIASRIELNGLAVRKARMEGLKGTELQARIDDLAAHPTDDMMQSATEKALYNTFQNDPGPIANQLVKVNQQVGWTKLIVPFVRTPANIIKYSVAHSPAAPLLKEFRTEYAKGGAARDVAVARAVFGTGLAATALDLAQRGLITADGPADPSARRALLETGWQPYSFKIGGKYYSYRRLDPFATTLGMAANAVELQSAMTEKQQKDAGALVVGSMVGNLASKTWLSGLSDFLDAVTDPAANAKNYITNMAASFATTSVTGSAARAIDPVSRDTSAEGYFDTIRKKVMAQTPVVSEALPAKRGLFGDEIKGEGSAVERFLTPIPTKDAKDDPIAKAVYDSGARFDLPKREVSGVRLSDEDYGTYQQLAGQKFIDAMKEELADPEWLTMGRDEQRKTIEKIKNSSRKEARGELFGMEQ